MSANTQVVKNYKLLLKHVKSLPSGSNWKGHVRSEFQKGRLETDQQRIEYLRALSTQYVTMVGSINELNYLRNIDCGEKLDPRDKIRATASRVGLGVPRFADDELPAELPPQTAKEIAAKKAKADLAARAAEVTSDSTTI